MDGKMALNCECCFSLNCECCFFLLLTTALPRRRGLRTSVTPRAMLAGAQAPSRATHARQVKG